MSELSDLTLEECLKPIEPRPKETKEDEIVRLLAESFERKLNRAERSIVNKAEWASKPGPIHVISEKKEAARMPVGTPLGNKQRIQQFKEMLLTQENGNKVIGKILAIAMNDEHPGQMNALKMCIDRQLPVSMFEAKAGGQRTAISISITGINDVATVIENDTGDVTDV